jgi:molecular chaperone DnaK
VLAHVDRALGGALAKLDTTDPIVLAAVARLRQECVDAKEALSADTEVSVPVLLTDLQTQVRMVRSEFETMIRPAINESIAALRRALEGAGVTPQDISAVLLVGGSSRIPLVAQMVSAELGRPIAVDTHPKHAVALGVALAAGTGAGVGAPEPAEAPARPPPAPASPLRASRRAPASPPPPAPRRTPRSASRRQPNEAVEDSFLPPVVGGALPSERRDRRVMRIVVGIGALVLTAWLLFRAVGSAGAVEIDAPVPPVLSDMWGWPVPRI